MDNKYARACPSCFKECERKQDKKVTEEKQSFTLSAEPCIQDTSGESGVEKIILTRSV